MGGFDQRSQNVRKQINISGDQYNAGRDINKISGDVVHGDKFTGDKFTGDKVLGDKFTGDKIAGNKNVYITIGAELMTLLAQVREKAGAGDLDPVVALDVTESLKLAESEAKSEEPDKSKLLGHVAKANEILIKAAAGGEATATIASAAGTAFAAISALF